MSSPHLWLRAETKPMEHRAALAPSTAKTLLDAGFKITVERSPERIFDDKEYEAVGCPLVPALSWKTDAPADAYIVGLKELPENDDSPLHHTHIFFAHCFKEQGGWKEILHRFDQGNGTILDLEFLHDANGRRVAAFGYMAGFTGSAVAIDVWCHQRLHPGVTFPALHPYPNEEALIAHTKERLAAATKGGKLPKVMVMGALVAAVLVLATLLVVLVFPKRIIIKWDMNETKNGPFREIVKLVSHTELNIESIGPILVRLWLNSSILSVTDIFVNCIYLAKKIPPFVTSELLDGERALSVICDVSCDTTNPNNPIPVYSINTTFDKPTVPVKTTNPHPLDVISIDHLPTLLPRESSEMFSRDLLPTLLELKDRQNARVWTEAEDLFKQKLAASKQ